MDYYRPAADRGSANFGWLDSRHSFSFGYYYDPRHMGISALRVINDDRVTAGAGFDAHPHQNMEIISYILEGSIEHADSMGHKNVIPAGDIQRMSAGTGVFHSEYNPSSTEELRFLQIWILPNVANVEPGYEQAHVVQDGKLTPLITPDGRDGTLSIHQDASLSRIELNIGEDLDIQFGDRTGYLHVLSGSAQATTSLNQKQVVKNADGLGIIRADQLNLVAENDKFEALWFDLPAV